MVSWLPTLLKRTWHRDEGVMTAAAVAEAEVKLSGRGCVMGMGQSTLLRNWEQGRKGGQVKRGGVCLYFRSRAKAALSSTVLCRYVISVHRVAYWPGGLGKMIPGSKQQWISARVPQLTATDDGLVAHARYEERQRERERKISRVACVHTQDSSTAPLPMQGK